MALIECRSHILILDLYTQYKPILNCLATTHNAIDNRPQTDVTIAIGRPTICSSNIGLQSIKVLWYSAMNNTTPLAPTPQKLMNGLLKIDWVTLC